MLDLTDTQARGVDRFETRPVLPPARLNALSRDILELKKELNAVILAHNYQVPEIQDVADFVGDSLGLSQQAAKTKAPVIVFCGVHFMAETAKILNPTKTVILPDADAGCSLEESCPGDRLKALQATNSRFYTISYINCSAEVKALSDVICTSGNAVKIVQAAPQDRDLLFVPDENLGAWVMEQTGRPMTLWRGNCYVHVEWTHASILRIREEFPGAPLVAHPECTKAVRMLADEVCSTEKMVSYCRQSPAQAFIIATESGMLHRLQKECPGKQFIPAPTDHCRCNECRFMKMNTLEKLYDCMANLAPRVELSEDILHRARLPIERMLEVSAQSQVRSELRAGTPT
jgi:quinolinate synthase